MTAYFIIKIAGLAALPILGFLIALKFAKPIVEASWKPSEPISWPPSSFFQIALAAIAAVTVAASAMIGRPDVVESEPIYFGPLMMDDWLKLIEVTALSILAIIVILFVVRPLIKAAQFSLTDEVIEQAPWFRKGAMKFMAWKGTPIVFAIVLPVLLSIAILFDSMPEGFKDCFFPADDLSKRIVGCTLVINDQATGENLRASALLNRGLDHHEAGETNKALHDLKLSLAQKDGSARAHNLLAWLLATSKNSENRDPEMAIVHARKALHLEENANFRDTFAASFAAAGMYEEALDQSALAIRMAEEADDKKLIPGFKARQILFKERRPLVCPGGPCD